MVVSREEVMHLARLSALGLSEAEIVSLTNNIENIVSYISQLQEVDTEGIEPLLQPIAGTVSPLFDEIEPYSDPDGLLQNVQHQTYERQIVLSGRKAEEES